MFTTMKMYACSAVKIDQKKQAKNFKWGGGFCSVCHPYSTFRVCYLGDLHLVFLYQVVNVLH